MNGQQPIIILKEGTERERGNDAQSNNIMAAVAIADAVKSTLGPKGMDKMLVDSMGDVTITNDGATILKEIDVEHPAAKMIVEVSKSQDEECGDGTTSAVIITGELLKVAKNLLDKKIHPTIITKGYNIACDEAIKIINSLAIDIDPKDTNSLMWIAETSMASKNANVAKAKLSKVIVDAVTSVIDDNGKVDIDDVQLVKVHSNSIGDSEVLTGVVVDKERSNDAMPSSIKNANILLLNEALEVKKTEIDARIEIRDPAQLQKFLDEEEDMLRKMVKLIIDSGANVLFCQKGIDDLAEHFLTEKGVYAIKRVSKSDMERVSKATGATILNNLDDISSKHLGKAGVVEEKRYGTTKLTYITECKNPKAVSIVIHGSTQHIIDEVERALHDAISVVKGAIEDKKIIAGGGATATAIAIYLRQYAPNIGGREQMAIEAFADAMEIIPKVLAENAGLDPIDLLIELKSRQSNGSMYAGINVLTGEVTDMIGDNIIEPIRVGLHEIKASTEAAIMILRIDDVIASRKTSMDSQPQMPPQYM